MTRAEQLFLYPLSISINRGLYFSRGIRRKTDLVSKLHLHHWWLLLLLPHVLGSPWDVLEEQLGHVALYPGKVDLTRKVRLEARVLPGRHHPLHHLRRHHRHLRTVSRLRRVTRLWRVSRRHHVWRHGVLWLDCRRHLAASVPLCGLKHLIYIKLHQFGRDGSVWFPLLLLLLLLLVVLWSVLLRVILTGVRIRTPRFLRSREVHDRGSDKQAERDHSHQLENIVRDFHAFQNRDIVDRMPNEFFLLKMFQHSRVTRKNVRSQGIQAILG